MREPWEIFFEEWRAVARAQGEPPVKEERDTSRLAAATSRAASATMAALRGSLDWSLIHSCILVGRFVEAADRWTWESCGEERLRESLVSVWAAERGLCRIERERRLATEAVLAAAGGMPPAWRPGRDEVAGELQAW